MWAGLEAVGFARGTSSECEVWYWRSPAHRFRVTAVHTPDGRWLVGAWTALYDDGHTRRVHVEPARRRVLHLLAALGDAAAERRLGCR